MHPYLRELAVIASALRAPPLEAFDECRLSLRVSAQDVELTRMNNGRYLTLMDFGRIAYAVRCGLFRALVRNRWAPLVGGVSIRFRKSLKVGQRFELVTRFVAYDEKYFYAEQLFEADGQVYASAMVKGLFHGPHGSVPSRQIFVAAGRPLVESPPLPEAFRLWLASEDAIRAASREEPRRTAAHAVS